MDFEKLDVKHRIQRSASLAIAYTPYRNQDYETLRKECLAKKTLFEDPLFPPIDTSISYTRPPPYGTKWKRPFEIVKSGVKPIFIDTDANCSDLDQGSLGNCWFIAGCAAIALEPQLFYKVVPKNQIINGDGYAGIFHFRFWIYGDWCDVVIDDRLPVTSSNELLFCRNKQQPNEFWPALLEKAYAKVCLSYENLDGGFTTDALIDMSGGIQETFNIKSMQKTAEKNQMWKILISSRQHKSLIGCSIAPNPRIKEARLYNGLVMGHAYTVTKVALIERYGREERLLRIRNPWGNEVEWKGAWSDKSYDWSTISDDLKKQLEYRNLPDGEAWMSYDDFYANFETLEFCSLTPEAYSTELGRHNAKLTWKLVAYHGAWVRGQSAGGCGKDNERAFWTNPQFLITLTDVDPDDNENLATIIISLMQKNTREKRMRNYGEASEDFIQFRLFRIKNPEDAAEAKRKSTRLYPNQLEKVGTSGSYTNLRDVTRRFRVSPGDYMIVPSTYDEGNDGEFLLRLFTEHELHENDCKILHDHKDDISNDDMFFTSKNSDAIDSLFSNWSNLIKGNNSDFLTSDEQKLRSDNVSARHSDVAVKEEPESYHKKSVKIEKHRNAKEACIVM